MYPRGPSGPSLRGVRREIRPTRPRPNRKRGARLRTLLLLAALAGAAWVLWQRSLAPGISAPVVSVRVGAVEEIVEADALILRQERVVTAPVAGQVRRLATDGERVRVGTPVAEISPASSGTPAATAQAKAEAGAGAGVLAGQREYDRLNGEIYRAAVALNAARYGGDAKKADLLAADLDSLARRQAALLAQVPKSAPAALAPPSAVASTEGVRVTSPSAGLLLFQIDGLEAILTPAAAGSWTPSWLSTLPYPDPRPTGEGVVVAGQPIFKVIDDLALDLVLVVPASRITVAQRTQIADQGVTVRVPGKDRAVTARLKRVAEEGESLLLHLTLPLPASDAMRVRRMRVTLLLERFAGTIVPRTAIDVVNGRSGVWLWVSGKAEFLPVTVVGGNPDEVAVKGEIPPDAKVLKELPPPSH